MPARSAIVGAFGVLTFLLPSSAFAAGLPVDVELVHPTLAPGGTPGQDTPWVHAPGAPRLAALVQSERNPVVVYADGDYAGPLVASRTLIQAGGRWSPVRRVDVSLAVPLAWQEGGVLPGSAEGFALGDLELGARVQVFGKPEATALAVKADVQLPTGAKDAWMGAGAVRPGGALLGAFAYGPAAIIGQAGARWSPTSAEDLGVVGGPQLEGGATFRYDLGRLAMGFGWLGRKRLADEAGPRDDASALLGTLSYESKKGVTVDLGGGPGLVGGVGGASARAYLGVAWTPNPPPRVARPVSRTALRLAPPEIEPLEIIPEKEPPKKPEWSEGELARVVEDRIVVKDPVQFVFAKDQILDESLPILRDVARVIAEDPRIAYVVIEGHASEEGSFIYNYGLSESRARAIYKVLIEEGVHPDRIGYRAMGEVAPKNLGVDEANLAENRRVMFRIERVIPKAEPAPDWPLSPVPWTGKPPRTRK